MFEFFPIVDGLFSIAVIAIVIAFVGNILLRLLGLSGSSGSLGPASFLAGLILLVALYLILPTIKKAGLIPDFLSVEFFAWSILIVFVLVPLLIFVVALVSSVLNLIGDHILKKLMTTNGREKPWFLLFVFYLFPVLIIVVAVIYPLVS